MNQERHDETGDAKHGSFDRRQFPASTAAIGGLPLLMNDSGATAIAQDVVAPINSTKSIIGGYGSWVAGLSNEPALTSLRNGGGKDLDAWHDEGRAKTMECIAPPDIGVNPIATVKRNIEQREPNIKQRGPEPNPVIGSEQGVGLLAPVHAIVWGSNLRCKPSLAFQTGCIGLRCVRRRTLAKVVGGSRLG